MKIANNGLKYMILALVMVFALGFASISFAADEMKAEEVDLNGNWFRSDPVTITEGEYKPGDLGLVLKNGKIGFINSSGEEVIPCQFDDDELSKFYKTGLAVVVKDGKYGMINTSGKVIVPFIYDGIDNTSEDALYVSAVKDGKSGYISLTGEKGLPFCFDEAVSFGNDTPDLKYGAVSLNDKWGLISADNKIVLPIKYDYLTIEQGGYVVVTHNDKQGLLSPDLKEILPMEFDTVDVVPMGESYAVCVFKGDTSYIYSTEGKKLADCGQTFLDYAYDGNSIGIIAALSSGYEEDQDGDSLDSYTLYNMKGKKVTDKSYKWYEVAGQAIGAETKDGCGMLDASGAELVPFKYDKFEIIEGTKDPVCFAFFKKGEGWTIFDDAGKRVNSLDWMKLTVPADSEVILIGDGRYYVSDEEVSYGPAIGDLYDADGNKLNKGTAKIISWQQVGNSVAAVDDSGKYGIMDLDGNMLVPCEYGAIESSDYRIGKFFFAYDVSQDFDEVDEDYPYVEGSGESDGKASADSGSSDGEESNAGAEGYTSSSGAEKVEYFNAKGKKVTDKIYDDPWDTFLSKFND